MTFEKELQRELDSLDKRGLSVKVVNKIREFDKDMAIQGKSSTGEGLSTGRRYAYVLRLRKIADLIPDKFLNPTEKDLKFVVSKIAEKRIKWGSGDFHKLTQNGLQAYLVALKKFYKWHLGKNKSYPECVEWIKIGNGHPSREIKPESLITQEEVNQLIAVCENARDKAIFSTLYDSGIRLGELLTMRIRDVDFDEVGALLKVTGKTGYRQVRVVGNSIPYLRAWIEIHPKGKNKDSVIFCNLSEGIRGRMLTHHDVYSIFKKVSRRAGITRRINPHLFRHTRATILASKVTEAPLESQMGWVHGSKQTKTYVHLSLRDQDNAILKAYGIEVKDDRKIEEQRPTECSRCHKLNPSNSLYCNTCGMPLDVKTAIELDEKKREVESRLIGSSVVDDSTKQLLKTFDPEFKDKLLEAVLSQIVGNPQLKERFTKEIGSKQ